MVCAGGFDEFQFTPLREGRRCSENMVEVITIFQFTPLREGRHEEMQRVRQKANISIHAPPRGATIVRHHRRFKAAFQFTPLREGRPFRPRPAPSGRNFNSRPSARGDSMHSPAWRGFFYFNSRPSARGDKGRNRTGYGGTHFNSRPSARDDASDATTENSYNISIHAPPRGATWGRCFRG